MRLCERPWLTATNAGIRIANRSTRFRPWPPPRPPRQAAASPVGRGHVGNGGNCKGGAASPT
eukprot:3073104-Alexandrium_andersonii.AAC.1